MSGQEETKRYILMRHGTTTDRVYDQEQPRPETVSVPLKKFNQMVKDQRELRALEAAGVDNWEGYSEAMRALYGDAEEEEDD